MSVVPTTLYATREYAHHLIAKRQLTSASRSLPGPICSGADEATLITRYCRRWRQWPMPNLFLGYSEVSVPVAAVIACSEGQAS